ncbi:MAG TPA: hypothetical protein VIM11_21260 [Tepidisphaeraceae bacterium]|jgi:hypothetical protein
MRRKLFTFAALLSLVLCAATVVLWVRSFWHEDDIEKVWHDTSKLQSEMLSGYSIFGIVVLSYGRFTYATRPHMSSDVEMLWHDERMSFRVRSFPAEKEIGLAGNRWWNQMGFRITACDKPFCVVAFRSKALDWRRQWWINVPHWSVAASFAGPPAWWFVTFRRRRHRRANACPTCGYNLTGNTSGICPECGTAVVENVTITT